MFRLFQFCGSWVRVAGVADVRDVPGCGRSGPGVWGSGWGVLDLDFAWSGSSGFAGRRAADA